MAARTFFANSNPSQEGRKRSDKLTITPSDLKQIIEEYNQNKTVTCIHPISSFIKDLKKLYDKHYHDNSCLTATEILILVKQVYNLNYNSPFAYSAVVKNNKIKKLLSFYQNCCDLYHDNTKYFNLDNLTLILNNPFMLDDLEIIFSHYNIRFTRKIPDINPNILRVIADKAQQRIISYKVFDETIFPLLSNDPSLVDACAAFDLLEKMDQVIYHNSKSVNQHYKAKLKSQNNIDFIYKHKEHSGLISQILVDLHQGVIGLDAQNKAEECIRQIGESEGSDSKQEFQSISRAFHLLKINKLLNASNANYIVTLCDEKYRPFAEQMAKAAADFHAQNKLDSNAWNIIKRNPANSPFISQILGMLEQAALSDLKNSVYLKSNQITETVAAVFLKLHNANHPLLSRDNVTLLLGKMHLADIILRNLPEEVTQQTFNNAMWVAEQVEIVASAQQPIRLKA